MGECWLVNGTLVYPRLLCLRKAHSARGDRIGMYQPGQLRRKHRGEGARERCVHVVLVTIDGLALYLDFKS